MAKIVHFMMSKQMFQRQLAAALFEELIDPVHEHITRVIEEEGSEEHLTSVFVVEPYSEILSEKTSDFDKIVETSMQDMDLEKMLLHIRNPQNYLFSKNEKVDVDLHSFTTRAKKTRPMPSMKPTLWAVLEALRPSMLRPLARVIIQKNTCSAV